MYHLTYVDVQIEVIDELTGTSLDRKLAIERRELRR